jgi:hypothetical protein
LYNPQGQNYIVLLRRKTEHKPAWKPKTPHCVPQRACLPERSDPDSVFVSGGAESKDPLDCGTIHYRITRCYRGISFQPRTGYAGFKNMPLSSRPESRQRFSVGTEWRDLIGIGCHPDSSDHGKWSDEGPSSHDFPSSVE